mgnify:CR=1 FL=1
MKTFQTIVIATVLLSMLLRIDPIAAQKLAKRLKKNIKILGRKETQKIKAGAIEMQKDFLKNMPLIVSLEKKRIMLSSSLKVKQS